jgi:hypothetical protein
VTKCRCYQLSSRWVNASSESISQEKSKPLPPKEHAAMKYTLVHHLFGSSSAPYSSAHHSLILPLLLFILFFFLTSCFFQPTSFPFLHLYIPHIFFLLLLFFFAPTHSLSFYLILIPILSLFFFFAAIVFSVPFFTYFYIIPLRLLLSSFSPSLLFLFFILRSFFSFTTYSFPFSVLLLHSSCSLRLPLFHLF